MRKTRWTTGAAVATLTVAALTAVPAATATAAPSSGTPAVPSGAAVSAKGLYAPSVLVLTKSRGDDAGASAERAVMLRCLPVGGDHPAPAAACAALRGAGGDPAALPETVGDRNRVCTRDYRPVTVTVQGTWEGRLVSHTRTFGNSCELDRQTASVFAF